MVRVSDNQIVTYHGRYQNDAREIKQIDDERYSSAPSTIFGAPGHWWVIRDRVPADEGVENRGIYCNLQH